MESKPARSRSEAISQGDTTASALGVDVLEARAGLDSELFRTAGIRRNGKKIFAVPFSGEEIYDLLRFFEEAAVLGEDYPRVRACVLFCEKLRQRAIRAGF